MNEASSRVNRTTMLTRRGLLTFGATAAATAVVGFGTSGGARASAANPPSMRAHVAALQRIADQHGGNRAMATQGYEASSRYFESVLSGAGLAWRRQRFEVVRDLADELQVDDVSAGRRALDAEAIVGLSSTPPGGIRAHVIVPRLPGGTQGAWEGVDATDRIALVVLDEFDAGAVRVRLREAADARVKAVLFRHPAPGAAGSLRMTEPGDAQLPPAVLLDGDAFDALTPSTEVRVCSSTRLDVRQASWNLLATIPGSAAPRVLSGAHLDSAPEGPGINDNGAGAVIVLTAAVRQARSGPAPIEFCFWGGEEEGVLGSTHFVSDLEASGSLSRIRSVLNIEGPGSPNPALHVKSNREDHPYADALQATGRAWHFEKVDSDGTDTAPFLSRDIAAATITTWGHGDGFRLAADEAGAFNGVVGAPYDPNYHTPGDTADKLRWDAIDVVAAATASAHRKALGTS